MGNYKLKLMTCLLFQVNSCQLLPKEQRPLIKGRMRCRMEEQTKRWTGVQEVCMRCPSCQRFPTCSGALSLCIHAINPGFNMKKVGFSFCLVLPNCSLFGDTRVSFQAFIQCLQQQDIGFAQLPNDRILLFEDTNNSMRKGTSEASKQPQHKGDKVI